jgi:predicted transposase/invertase (TIGR01784 family)
VYDKWKIAAMTERSALKDAKKEGVMEGIKEGIKEGITATALNMLKDGMAVENICKYTGLSKEQIDKLKANL